MSTPNPTHSVKEALVRAAEALGEAIERDPDLREALEGVAEAWLGALERPGPSDTDAEQGAGEGPDRYDASARPGDDSPGEAGSRTGEEHRSVIDGGETPPLRARSENLAQMDRLCRFEDSRGSAPVAPGDGGVAEGDEGGTSRNEAREPEAVEGATREQLEELVAVFSGEGEAQSTSSRPEVVDASVGGSRFLAEELSPRLISERCRLKARACELVLKFQDADDAESEAQSRREIAQLIAQARALPDCYLWILRSEARHWVSPESLELLARAFEILADAMSLAAAIDDEGQRERSEMERILALAAEAQRSVREATIPFVPPSRDFEDSDQLAAFRWIIDRCDVLGIFVARYLKIDDVADPMEWHSLAVRIEALGDERHARIEGNRAANKLWGKLRYESKRLAEDPDEDFDARAAKIAETVQGLTKSGVAPSDRRLRELLLPVFDLLLEAVEPAPDADGFRLALRETDRYLSQMEATAGSREEDVRDPETEAVRQVREWLRGKALVLIGGEEREAAARRLKETFELEELVWVATRPHESNELFEAPVARENVAAVLLAIRWSSHSYAGVKSLCDEAGKPLVRLPGGYGVNRVAAEIAAQASGAWESA